VVVQHPVRPRGSVGQPARAGKRGPEVIGIPGLFLARIPALLLSPPTLIPGLPALGLGALAVPLGLHLLRQGPPAVVRLALAAAAGLGPAATLPGFRPLRVCPLTISVRHVATRSS
jgi:hypothetical protein